MRASPVKKNRPSDKLITMQQTQQNINSQFSINADVQLMLANGNTQFMIQLSRQMKFSYTLPTLALQISAKFFHIRCYINYDRFIILTACLLLAAKFKDMDLRVKNLCYTFYKTVTNRSQSHVQYDEDKLKKIRDQICIAEAEILRTLQYQIDYTTPHEYIRKYLDISFENTQSGKKRIFEATRILILDSNRVQLSLYFNSLTIFVACLMIASSYEGIKPYSYLQESPMTNTGNSQHIQNRCEEDLYRQWIGILSNYQKQSIKEEDVKNCIKSLNRIIFGH